MYSFSKSSLSKAFENSFTCINTRHGYNTRLSSKSSFALPNIRTNDGKFNIKVFGPKVWNQVNKSMKTLVSDALNGNLKRISYSVILVFTNSN